MWDISNIQLRLEETTKSKYDRICCLWYVFLPLHRNAPVQTCPGIWFIIFNKKCSHSMVWSKYVRNHGRRLHGIFRFKWIIETGWDFQPDVGKWRFQKTHTTSLSSINAVKLSWCQWYRPICLDMEPSYKSIIQAPHNRAFFHNWQHGRSNNRHHCSHRLPMPSKILKVWPFLLTHRLKKMPRIVVELRQALSPQIMKVSSTCCFSHPSSLTLGLHNGHWRAACNELRSVRVSRAEEWQSINMATYLTDIFILMLGGDYPSIQKSQNKHHLFLYMYYSYNANANDLAQFVWTWDCLIKASFSNTTQHDVLSQQDTRVTNNIHNCSNR